MTKIDIRAVPVRTGCGYPTPFDEPCLMRSRRPLGDAAGLTQFGVNLLVLPPNAWSAQRHWHEAEDEFIYVLSGEVILVTNAGEELLQAGDCAGFKAGVPNGHHLINRSSSTAQVLEVGTRVKEGEDSVDYPDLDLVIPRGMSPRGSGYHHRDGRPYPKKG
ncbi:MAG: cupin protein [Myxococcales bacterium]|nr:cupin protein [Myxococcales bacterium]